MNFRTEYVAVRGGFVLDPEVPVAGVGSCFSENVIRRMRRTLWDAVNPLSTLFNPLSIANGLVTLHADLSEVMAAAEGDDETSATCKIIAKSLYADGPMVEVTVAKAPIQTGIEEIVNDNQPESNFIDFDKEYEVYNFSGALLGNSVKNLERDIYIVRQGNVVKKIAVK